MPTGLKNEGQKQHSQQSQWCNIKQGTTGRNNREDKGTGVEEQVKQTGAGAGPDRNHPVLQAPCCWINKVLSFKNLSLKIRKATNQTKMQSFLLCWPKSESDFCGETGDKGPARQKRHSLVLSGRHDTKLRSMPWDETYFPLGGGVPEAQIQLTLKRKQSPNILAKTVPLLS